MSQVRILSPRPLIFKHFFLSQPPRFGIWSQLFCGLVTDSVTRFWGQDGHADSLPAAANQPRFTIKLQRLPQGRSPVASDVPADHRAGGARAECCAALGCRTADP